MTKVFFSALVFLILSTARAESTRFSTMSHCEKTVSSSNTVSVERFQTLATQFITKKIADIQNKLETTWESKNPDDWIETDNQEEATYVQVLAKRQELLQSAQSDAIIPTLEELFAVHLYTGFAFKTINSWLFSLVDFQDYITKMNLIFNDPAKPPSLTDAIIPVMCSGLSKLPVYDKIVYRSAYSRMSTDEDVAMEKAKKHFESYEDEITAKQNNSQKSNYIFDGFMSTTKGTKQDAQETFVKTATLLLIIEHKSGRDIENISNHPDEEEVVFLPFSEFTVRKKEEIKNDLGQTIQYKMYLTEK
jgi:hypothetical protein